VPTTDATAVRRLRAAGAILLGKHATHELAWGGRTDSAHLGPTHNPRRRGHVAGGSSGGSGASVAVGSSLGAIGTDTAGSVRIPAALSGCVGYKPTRGRVSLAGVMPLSPTLDHVGSLARTVADAACIVDAIAGPDARDDRALHLPASSGDGIVRGAEALDGLSVGVLEGWFTELLDPGVAAAYAAARDRLVALGLRVEPVALDPGPGMPEAVLTRILSEAGPRHRPMFEEHPEDFGADLAELLSLPPVSPRALLEAEAATSRFAAVLLGALVEHDVLLAPTVPVTAPLLGATTVSVGGQDLPVELVLTRLTAPFNATGLPAVSVPVALVDGLPAGVQAIGRPGEDGLALALAAAVEATVGVAVPQTVMRMPSAEPR
jgi:aspartyl-tRNA(Asn)/glutamyl-tRNA(Gln) amidotransferase subunit A